MFIWGQWVDHSLLVFQLLTSQPSSELIPRKYSLIQSLLCAVRCAGERRRGASVDLHLLARGTLWVSLYSKHNGTCCPPPPRSDDERMSCWLACQFIPISFLCITNNWGVMLVAESRGLFWKPVLFGFCLFFLQQNTDFKLTTWMQKSIALR